MTDKIPEALAVLELCHSYLPDGMLSDMRKARAAFAELYAAADHVYPAGVDYLQDAHGYAVRAALAAVEKLS